MQKNRLRILFVLMAMSLTACGGQSAGEVLGIARSVPDEFALVKRKPLSVPPDFTLRPPAEEVRDSALAVEEARVTTRKLLFGEDDDNQPSNPAFDAADQALLARFDADQSVEGIRRIVDQESTELVAADRNFVRDLLSFIIDQEPPGEVIDPASAGRSVRQQALLDALPPKATITRRSTDVDWSKLWPF